MTSPAPGWYPDPGGAAPFRWWNGQAWTTATSQGTPVAATQPAAPAAPGYGMGAQHGDDPAAQAGFGGNPQFGTVPGQFGAATEPVGTGSATAYGTKSPFDSSGQSNYSHAMRQQHSQGDTLFEQNRYAMGTFLASGLSVFFAVATGFVPLIVTPFFLAFYSRSKNEKLSPLAFAAAILCGVVGFITLRNRF